ncbi:MAG: DUF2520 domain-containing protein [Nitrospirae bacterium]|nr:DUF2520 domain-containing protein [Nitrospirota bacterium]
MSKTVSIIGAGVVGSAIGRLFRERGYDIKGVVCRSLEHAEKSIKFIGSGEPGVDAANAAKDADWVFITTPDRAIEKVCNEVSAGGGFSRGQLVVHMSGALNADVLDSARKAGARAVSIHPLQSLATASQAVSNLPGSYFSVEGDPDAMAEGKEVVEALCGLMLVVPSDQKALYHAGAAVASNYLVTVVDFAVEIYEMLGLDRKEAINAVMPLVRGTVNNIEKVGVPDALTGPIARGDVATVEGHLEVLKKKMPGMVRLYCELGKHAIKVGLAKGTLSQEDGARLFELLSRRV